MQKTLILSYFLMVLRIFMRAYKTIFVNKINEKYNVLDRLADDAVILAFANRLSADEAELVTAPPTVNELIALLQNTGFPRISAGNLCWSCSHPKRSWAIFSRLS